MKPRIIVCGLEATGYKIFCLLRQQEALVIGIHTQHIAFENDQIVVGELQSASTLITAGIKEAQTLVLAGDNEAINLAILTQARVLNPRIRIVNRLFNTSLGDRLDQTLPEHLTMSVAALAAPVFAFAAQGNRAIGQLQLFNQTWPIQEEYIDEHHAWKGRKLSDLWDDRSLMLIYYLPFKGRMDLVSAVVSVQELQVGDRLIIGTKPSIRHSEQSWLEKLLKVISNFRLFKQQGQSIIVVAFTVILTIFVATLT